MAQIIVLGSKDENKDYQQKLINYKKKIVSTRLKVVN